MKKLLIIGLTLVSCLVANASTFSTNNLAASTNHTILTTPFKLESITLFSTNLTPTIVKLIDGWVVSTNTAFTNYVQFSSNVVSSVITSTGVTNQYTNTVLMIDPVITAATTNGSPYVQKTIVVPGNNTLITVQGPISFSRRLTVDSSLTGLSFVMEYSSP